MRPRSRVEIERYLKNAKVIPKLPGVFRHGDDLPDGLTGATIINTGTVENNSGIEGDGLLLDFVPKGSAIVRRVVLAFNEVGMWVEFVGDA